jgi:hypothetical protein
MSNKRPPVEPLSRPAWERVEAGVFARLDRGEHLVASLDAPPSFSFPRRWLMGGALATAGSLAAAAAFALWFRASAPEEDMPIAPQAAVEAPIAPAPFRHEARIVSTDAPTETTLGGAVITLAAHSDVNVSGSDAEGWLVRLDAGRVDCKVAPRNGRPPFVVQGGATKVTVVGTRFTVVRSGAESRVGVTEGQVQVDSGDTHVLLSPGDSWPRVEPTLDPETLPEVDDPDDGEPSRDKSSASRTAQQRFERAARLEAKDPVAALAIYQQLARGKGPWAANALYAQARLELERGRPQRAEPLLRRYLERYPRGLNAADVRKQLSRIADAQK